MPKTLNTKIPATTFSFLMGDKMACKCNNVKEILRNFISTHHITSYKDLYETCDLDQMYSLVNKLCEEIGYESSNIGETGHKI